MVICQRFPTMFKAKLPILRRRFPGHFVRAFMNTDWYFYFLSQKDSITIRCVMLLSAGNNAALRGSTRYDCHMHASLKYRHCIASFLAFELIDLLNVFCTRRGSTSITTPRGNSPLPQTQKHVIDMNKLGTVTKIQNKNNDPLHEITN